MHLLFLVNHYPPGPPIGGIVTYTHFMARAWKRAGHEVSVVCQSQSGHREEEHRDGVRVVRIPSRPYPGAMWDKFRFRLAGDNSHRLLHHREFSYAALTEVQSWSRQPDLVESPEAFAWGWHLQRTGYPVVVRVHGPNRLAREADPGQGLLQARCLEEAEWEFMMDARGVFPTTQYMKRVLEGWGLRVQEPIVLPFDVLECRGAACCAQSQEAPHPTSPQEGEGQGGREGKRHALMAVGRVIAGKGFDTAIRVVAALGEPWTLEIIGPEGAPGAIEELTKLAAGLGAASQVIFVGTLSHVETLKRIASAWVLVHDSRNDNMPYVVLEAMALGMSVLASRVGGIPETVGTYGQLFEPGDVDGYVQAVRALPQSDDGEAAAWVCEKHDPMRIQQVCEMAYVGVLQNP